MQSFRIRSNNESVEMRRTAEKDGVYADWMGVRVELTGGELCITDLFVAVFCLICNSMARNSRLRVSFVLAMIVKSCL